MSKIDDNKESLYEFYKAHLGVDFEDNSLRKEFDKMLLLKFDYMPYFFVNELQRRGYDTIDILEPFE